MSKIALVYSFEESNWFSCVKIVGNLLKSYQIIQGIELVPVNYSAKMLATSLREAAEEIVEMKPDKVVFLDHKPHPNFLLKELFKVDQSFDAELVFHIYGDFTLYFHLWMNVDELLVGKKIKFLCASDKEVNLVKKFFNDKKTFIEKVPFPVDNTEFSYLETNSGIKEKYGLKNEDKVLLYTGRLSLQKNIVELVKIFLKAHADKKIPENTYLFLAGEFDTLGFLFADVYHHLGEYFRAYDRAFNKYPDNLKNKVKLLGSVPNKSLKEYYNDCELFVSFSTYHDEDYGMSVAEAGSCGMPLLLTDWGGFSSFLVSDKCYSVDTSLTRKGPTFDQQKGYDQLIRAVSELEPDKSSQYKAFKDNFSIEAVSDKISKVLKGRAVEFSGFNSFLYQLGRNYQFNSRVFFDDPDKVMNNYYFKVYDVYATENK